MYRKGTNCIIYALPKLDSKHHLPQSKSRDLNSGCLRQCTDHRATEEKQVEVDGNGSRHFPPSRNPAIKYTQAVPVDRVPLAK